MSIQRHRRNVSEVGGNSKRQLCGWLPRCATSGNHSCYSTKMLHIYQNSGGYVDLFKHDRSHLHRVMMCFISITYTSIKPHTHEAIHYHADRIFDWSPVGMVYWNVHV